MRKIILFSIINCLSHFYSYSQNCEMIKRFSTFHGVKIGSNIPQEIIKLASDIGFEQYKSSKAYNIFPNNKNIGNYIEWFNVLHYRFEGLTFNTTNANKIYSIRLIKMANNVDSEYIYNKNKLPPDYTSLLDKILSIVGKPNYFINDSIVYAALWEDSITHKPISAAIQHINLVRWACNNIKIEASSTFSGLFTSFNFSITDIDLEKQKELDDLTK